MKKSILLLSLLTLISMTSFAQHWNKGEEGKGPIVTKTLTLDNFNSFALTISGDVYLRQGNRQSVEVEGQQNIIDLLSTDVNEKHWKIKFDKNVSNIKSFKVYITIPDLVSVGLSGSGDIITKGKFTNLDDVDLRVSGSGNIKLGLDAQKIETRISGSGDIQLEGAAQKHSIRISGSGSVDAKKLAINEYEIRISGSGDVQIDVRNQLDVTISGSGDVRYSGNPSVRTKISGSGEVYGK